MILDFFTHFLCVLPHISPEPFNILCVSPRNRIYEIFFVINTLVAILIMLIYPWVSPPAVSMYHRTWPDVSFDAFEKCHMTPVRHRYNKTSAWVPSFDSPNNPLPVYHSAFVVLSFTYFCLVDLDNSSRTSNLLIVFFFI